MFTGQMGESPRRKELAKPDTAGFASMIEVQGMAYHLSLCKCDVTYAEASRKY